MHQEAYDGFKRMLAVAQDSNNFDRSAPWEGLDVGGRNVNGSVRAELPNTLWTGLDMRPGPDVDIVADAATWIPDRTYDIVIATELFEHAEKWREIIHTMWLALDPAGPGLFISTCASVGRPIHDANGNHSLPLGEWYSNVHPHVLRDELDKYFYAISVEYNPISCDAYAIAWSPLEHV